LRREQIIVYQKYQVNVWFLVIQGGGEVVNRAHYQKGWKGKKKGEWVYKKNCWGWNREKLNWGGRGKMGDQEGKSFNH